ncbi:MAG: 50S ribosomal protein L30 [bacterium]
MPAPKFIKVTLIRSTTGHLKKHKACVIGLGLRKIGSTRILEDTPSVRGMINKISYLLKIEDHRDPRVETRSRPGPRKRPADHRGYIWERDGWPVLTWNHEQLAPLITELAQDRAVLRARFDALGLPEHDRQTIADEISLLEISPGDPEGVAAMMRDATRNYDQPLTKERLCGWHKTLFPNAIADGKEIITGAYRDDRDGGMVVESGYIGKEQTHFEAPPAATVSAEMEALFEWLDHQSETAPDLIPAIAHLRLLTIHPFDNGNGRIARAITESILAANDDNPLRLYCISSQIHEQGKEYDFNIEWTQKGELDITNWLSWFLKLERAAITQSDKELPIALQRRAFWQACPEESLNPRQIKVMKKFLGPFEGKLTVKKWAKIASCSQDAAKQDITDLIQRGALQQLNPAKGEPHYKLDNALTNQDS